MAGLTNNPIELLITLGVNSPTSLLNINNAITKLKTQVGKMDIEINPIITNGNFTKGIIADLDAVQKKANETSKILGGLGGSGGSGGSGSSGGSGGSGSRPNNTPKIFAGYKDAVIDTITNLDQLKKYLNKNEFKFDVKMGIDKNGEAYVKKVIADMKNAKGEIETIHIKPIVDQNGLIRFEQFSKGLKDVSTFKLQEEIKKANYVLEDFRRRGKLAENDYKSLKTELSQAPNTKAISSIMKELTSKESAQVFEDTLGKALHNTGLKADQLFNKLNRLEKTNGSNASAKQIAELRKEIEQILKLPISTIDSSKIVAGKLAEVEKKIGYTSLSASDTKRFNDTLKKARDEIKKIEETGLLGENSIKKLYARISNVPIGNLDQLNKEFNKLQKSLTYFNDKKFVIDGIQQNALNVAALNAQLERGVNLNRKYINSADYNKLLGDIKNLSQANIRNGIEVENASKRYKVLRQEVATFNSAATQASRNSMTVLNAFKVAMERFPMENIQVGIKLS